MSITREQVADLRPGDVVEFRDDDWPDTLIAGPLVSTSIGLCLGNFTIVRWANGEPNERTRASLTVVSRSPRPLYVNHDRTEPVPGDVVRDAEGDEQDPTTFHFLPADPGLLEDPWVVPLARWEVRREPLSELPERLRLLVDGATGQVVQP